MNAALQSRLQYVDKLKLELETRLSRSMDGHDEENPSVDSSGLPMGYNQSHSNASGGNTHYQRSKHADDDVSSLGGGESDGYHYQHQHDSTSRIVQLQDELNEILVERDEYKMKYDASERKMLEIASMASTLKVIPLLLTTFLCVYACNMSHV